MTHNKIDLLPLAEALTDSVQAMRSLQTSLTEVVQLIDEGAFVGEQGSRMRNVLSDRVIPFTVQVGATCETLAQTIVLRD